MRCPSDCEALIPTQPLFAEARPIALVAMAIALSLAACSGSSGHGSGDDAGDAAFDGATGPDGAMSTDAGGPDDRDGATGTTMDPNDPSQGDRFTICVDGKPVAIGSATESGGISPAIPDHTTRATTPVPPLSGGTLLILADGLTAVASDPERDQVYVVDTTAAALRATVTLQAGDEPGRVAEDGAGMVHVVLRRGGAVATIDPRLGRVTDRRAVCAAPRGIAYAEATGELHVVCAGGELVTFPAAGPALPTQTVALDRDLRDVVVAADGSLMVSTFRTAELLMVSPDGKVTARLRPGAGQVPSTTRTPAVETRTPAVAWRTVAFDPAAPSVLMLHETGVTDLIDSVPGGYGGERDCGAVVQPGVSLLTPGAQPPPVASGLGAFALIIDLAVSPDRRTVALAIAGNDPVQGPTVLEAALAAVTPPTPIACGSVISDITTPLPSGQVVAVAYSAAGVLFAQTREPASLWRSDNGQVTPLAAGSRADTGHYLFHANSGAGLACASCHPEGGEDGRVWNFVCSGARRTQSVRGGISGTAPFHWDGSELDFGRLVDDVFSGRMAGPLLDDDPKNALGSWIDTIPPLPALAGLDGAAVARGRTLFQDATVGCATCHTAPLFTNNATVDVGTGNAYQVPSLRGVVWRTPLMHNGCAATLADRFTSPSCGGGDRHGVTSTLSAAQVSDLVAYMQSL